MIGGQPIFILKEGARRETGKDAMKGNIDGFYIFLTDQFKKQKICSFINLNCEGITIETVSGTIKKCKEKIKNKRNQIEIA